jgi:hypothetical protein
MTSNNHTSRLLPQDDSNTTFPTTQDSTQKHSNCTPKKHIILLDPATSPSLKDDSNLMKSVREMQHPETSTTMNLKDLQITTKNPIIVGRLQYKCNLKDNKNGRLGQFILYDREGNCANVICFTEQTIELHYNNLFEGDTVSIANPLLRMSNPMYTLCDCTVDIILGQFTIVTKLQPTEDMKFCVPFLPTTINAIKELLPVHEVVDCIAAVTTIPVVSTVQLTDRIEKFPQ